MRVESNKEYILDTCIAYIRQISYGIAGESYRLTLHQILIKHTHLNEDELQEILHNLDAYIGYNPDKVHFETQIVRFGYKLFEVIRRRMLDKVKEQFSDADKEFLLNRGITIEEWLDEWEENMELDEEGVPMLKKELEKSLGDEK